MRMQKECNINLLTISLTSLSSACYGKFGCPWSGFVQLESSYKMVFEEVTESIELR